MKFDYMFQDKICATVEVINNQVNVTNYVDSPHYRPFGRREKVTVEDFEEFLEDRCVPRTRYNINQILSEKTYGYMPLCIVKDTHGALAEDCFWLRFEGETLQWKDVNPRELSYDKATIEDI